MHWITQVLLIVMLLGIVCELSETNEILRKAFNIPKEK